MTAFHPIESAARLRREFGEHGGVNMSIEASTTFTVMDPGTMPEVFRGVLGPDVGGCYLYGRHFNPTVHALGKQLAALDGAEAAYCTSSGMGAISAVLMQLCRAGDRVVASHTVYGGTFALLHEFLREKMGLDVEFVDTNDHAAVEAALAKGAAALYVESMSNPTLRIPDVPKLAELAHAAGAQLVVDNTFCPLVLSPIQLGADVVVHSLTKFVNGASDIIAGAICGRAEFIAELMDLHRGAVMLCGPTMDPRVAAAISQRLPHLGLRMREHSRRALAYATRLKAKGYDVIYPGLSDHPDHDRLQTLRNDGFGSGGVLCIDLGTAERAHDAMGRLQNETGFGMIAVSLGFSETLMSCSASSTSSELPEDALQRAGIHEGLVRISVGFTGTLEQRWEQLERGLASLGA